MPNPFASLPYEPAFENLGGEYYDIVTPSQFPCHILRWRNDQLLPVLGLDPQVVTDEDFIEAFGYFRSDRRYLAMRYHGYQFGVYNPDLGDGRGFLYGQVRGRDGLLYDLGTKGSGQTPYSRGGDGKLTLKGGVREVLAAEALHRMGVTTFRCLSLIETGEQLWRGDEPSPTRSSVMVRMGRSHIRFGTFERLHYYQRPDLVRKLLDHVIANYYPHLLNHDPQAIDRLFYQEVVQRTAQLCAQWMSVGFCHGVLNTDNMAITGESFDYGPYAFIPTYNPGFTAAYFDYYGRYCYGNQPSACYWNLQQLQRSLALVMAQEDLEQGLESFIPTYQTAYRQLMLKRLGFPHLYQAWRSEQITALLQSTLEFLHLSQIDYNGFFAQLRRHFSPHWQKQKELILPDLLTSLKASQSPTVQQSFHRWQEAYHQLLLPLTTQELAEIPPTLQQANPMVYLLRPLIESVWEAIATEDDWQGFYHLVKDLQTS
jgi:uncharacterized protein YdiU (UPF0061 family)